MTIPTKNYPLPHTNTFSATHFQNRPLNHGAMLGLIPSCSTGQPQWQFARKQNKTNYNSMANGVLQNSTVQHDRLT